MKITVITASFNNQDTIQDTIESVLKQSYSDVEYLIMDGGSTDATLSIVGEYKDRIHKVVSEKDGGIYFALNKGIAVATGDVIAFLHADDVYASEFVLEKVMKKFEELNMDSVYGDLVYVDRNDLSKVVRSWKSEPYYDGIFLKGWMPPHPSFFLKKKCYDLYGNFNTKFRFASDYELMLRMLHKHRISTDYLSEILVKMRVGGTSNASISNRLKANKEDRLAWKINGLKPNAFTLTKKPLSKIFQFFGKK